jgi:hypothetical protein
MLVFGDTFLQLLSCCLIFSFGLITAIVQKKYLSLSHQYALILYLWHSLFCLYNYYASLNGGYDSTTYYLSSLETESQLGLGTSAVIYFVAFFSSSLSLSYGATFLVFNVIGFLGVLAFASSIFEAYQNIPNRFRLYIVLIPFLPGLNFWTSSIGKEPLAMFAIGFTCWAALYPRARYPALAFSLLIMIFIRPHIAALLVASFVVTLTLQVRISLLKKILLLSLSILILVTSFIFAISYSGFTHIPSLDSLNAYLDLRATYNSEGNTSIDLESMSVPIRLFSYLYRPLFYDSTGPLAVFVSLENALILAVTLCALIVFCLRPRIASFGKLAFFSIYSLFCLLLLANTTANLGIAIRQKWMFMPMLLLSSIIILFRPRRT